jgi:hypothetical protein
MSLVSTLLLFGRRAVASLADEHLDPPFTDDDVARLHALTASGAGARAVDEQTWKEMLLPAWLARLSLHTSIAGRQWLYRRLRGADDDGGSSVARVQALLADAPARARLEQACRCLRQADTEVATSLFAPLAAAPAWLNWIWLLPVTFILSLALIVLWVPGWPLCLAAWIALMVVQLRFERAVTEWESVLAALGWQLRAHSLLAALDEPLAPGFRAGAAQAGRLNRRLNPASPSAMLPGAREYGNWVMLANVRRYARSRALFLREREFLRGSYRLVAELEADLTLARHLAGADVFCWSAPAIDGALILDGAVHPLLTQASPISLSLEKQGAFISGQNGIGNSTLLRTVGINAIVGRAFGFCYARAARVPPLPLHSSMQSEDSLDAGESLYNAELRRARELLALAQAGPAIFLIDEIFRGTNHLESVAAAAAVLHELAGAGLVVVSSHNVVLGTLLGARLESLCLSHGDGGLALQPGLLRDTNGLALLAERGFGAAIEARAARVFDWLAAHALTQAAPHECAGLLEG